MPMTGHPQQIDRHLLDSYAETARCCADLSGRVIRKWFRAGFDVHSKPDNTPVTIADREAEEAICDLIERRHPGDGILGEETGTTNPGADWLWVIDPIDGTKGFSTGLPTFGTLIALLYRGKPVIGVMDHPALDERWVGVAGAPTTHNGRPCRTRQTDRLSDASVHVTTPDMFDPQRQGQMDILTKRCRFRVFGGDCYNYGLVASGFSDLVCEADLKPHDYCALIPVLEGAGGVITDWQGRPPGLESTGEILASGCRTIHRQALEALNAAG